MLFAKVSSYSSPDSSFHTEIQIGTVLRTIFDIDDINDTDITQYTYYSKDSNERMDLIFEEEKLKLILVTAKQEE